MSKPRLQTHVIEDVTRALVICFFTDGHMKFPVIGWRIEVDHARSSDADASDHKIPIIAGAMTAVYCIEQWGSLFVFPGERVFLNEKDALDYGSNHPLLNGITHGVSA